MIFLLLTVFSVPFGAARSFVCLIWMVHITLSFLKLFTLKREQKDGVVGPVARTVLKIIRFALYSVADLLHNPG